LRFSTSLPITRSPSPLKVCGLPSFAGADVVAGVVLVVVCGVVLVVVCRVVLVCVGVVAVCVPVPEVERGVVDVGVGATVVVLVAGAVDTRFDGSSSDEEPQPPATSAKAMKAQPCLRRLPIGLSGRAGT
jgi:hypothetical protein